MQKFIIGYCGGVELNSRKVREEITGVAQEISRSGSGF
jgi:hypothetical protein